MVKGISRQVIVVDAPEPKLFEQAIFILKDDVGEGVTDELLLKEAQQAIQGSTRQRKKRFFYLYAAVWTAVGALITGGLWLLTWLM